MKFGFNLMRAAITRGGHSWNGDVSLAPRVLRRDELAQYVSDILLWNAEELV